jgi:hypothetical protein
VVERLKLPYGVGYLQLRVGHLGGRRRYGGLQNRNLRVFLGYLRLGERNGLLELLDIKVERSYGALERLFLCRSRRELRLELRYLILQVLDLRVCLIDLILEVGGAVRVHAYRETAQDEYRCEDSKLKSASEYIRHGFIVPFPMRF